MFSDFINEMTVKSRKNTIRSQSKTEEKTMKNTHSNKKPVPQYTFLDNIKKQCTSLYNSLLEFAQWTGNRKRVSSLSSEDPSSYPNIRTRYRTLGEDFEGKDFEKPARSTSSRLFHLSGKRVQKAINKSLSSVRRVVLDIEKISYNTVDQSKRFSRAMKKADPYAELVLKRRSRIRNDVVTA